MNVRIKHQFAAIAILFVTSSLMGDDTKPDAPASPAAAIPDIAPFLLPSLEDRYSIESTKAEAVTAKADAEVARIRKTPADARLKGYKDKLVEVTKTGDFDKAQQIKARITQLETEPEGESHKPSKRPRPKDIVKFGGHTYALIKEPATWHVAKLRCEEMGGHLAVIESREEEEFVAHLCSACDRAVWVGASDEAEEGNWLWVNGKPVMMQKVKLSNAPTSNWLAYYPPVKGFVDNSAGDRIYFVAEWSR